MVDRILTVMSYTAGLVSGVAILVMAVVTAVQVVARQVFHRPLVDAVLAGELSVVVMTYLGLAWVYRLGRHVSVRIVIDRLGWRARLWTEVIGLSLSLVGLAVVIKQSWEFAHASLVLGERLSGIVRVQAFPFHVLIPIGFSLLALEVVRTIVLDLRALKRDRPDLAPGRSEAQDVD